jgi:transglutaminase-like putative cysteine protease
MKIEIRYSANYRYVDPVSFSPHIVRLFPKASHDVVIERLDFETNTGADVQYRRDLFDNNIAVCFYPARDKTLGVRLELLVEVQERNAFHFLLASHAVDFPFAYSSHERRVLDPYLETTAPVELPFWKPESKPTVTALVELNSAIHDHLKYERRDEGAARSPAETLSLGAGACRDFAVLLAETLRANGVAARLASGYLLEFGESEKFAQGALHAWTEAYLPGAGWTGLDPTNGTFCNHNHLTAAVGLTPDDVSPVSGNYYSQKHVPSQMDSALAMELR